MIAILTYEPEHLAQLVDQEAQRGEAERLGQARGAAAELGPAFSAVELDGEGRVAKVLCCAGLAENVPPSAASGGYATAWAYFAAGLTLRNWSTIMAAIRSVLSGCGYARIDLLAAAANPAARRFAEALGFRLDGYLMARAPNGEIG